MPRSRNSNLDWYLTRALITGLLARELPAGIAAEREKSS